MHWLFDRHLRVAHSAAHNLSYTVEAGMGIIPNKYAPDWAYQMTWTSIIHTNAAETISCGKWLYGVAMKWYPQIAKALGSKLIIHRSDAKILDQCLNYVDPRVFVIWDPNDFRHSMKGKLWTLWDTQHIWNTYTSHNLDKWCTITFVVKYNYEYWNNSWKNNGGKIQANISWIYVNRLDVELTK